ncbi:tetratricopeptide repeat protein [Sphingopyxis sp. PET50]|uniref:tetratricopeptide repeat protein n=1 Tax=Sphingopyxis sp. PET50 TaxID=2976533 RepID=UPI0021B00D28|nr:tetratricopeptide repeat protein [Sphingopyxis sp. PET50]
MALSPTNNAALLQEVDEAVRKDQLDSIWQRFGRWIIAGVIAALLAFGGYLYWGHLQDSKRGENAEALIAALDKLKSGEPTAATKELTAIEADGNGAYRAASLFQQANLKADRGDLKGAAALMAKAAADTELDQSLRDLALLRQTAFEYDTLKPETVIARMKPMVDAKDPVSAWFPSAAELSAIAHYQLGQYKEAGVLYGRIADVPTIPKSLQSRAVQMAGMLGVDAVKDRAAESAEKDEQAGVAPKANTAGQAEEKK